MSNAIITPRKYSSVGAIRRALSKASGTTVGLTKAPPLKRPYSATTNDGTLGSRSGNTVAASPSRSQLRHPDADAEHDSATTGRGAPVPGNPSFPRRKVPNSPTRTGF